MTTPEIAQGRPTGEQPWSRLWDERHGEAWARDARWAQTHDAALRGALLG